MSTPDKSAAKAAGKAQPAADGAYEKVTPEVQRTLQIALEATFGPKLTPLPAHAWEYGLTYGVSVAGALEVFAALKENPAFSFNMLINVTAVDWMDRREPRFDVVYQLLSLKHLHRLCIKVQTSEEKPEVHSVRSIWQSANFMEREVWDMYGISFAGHGDLRRILMYDEFEGHPLRKDYPLRGKQPRVTLRIPELRNTSADMSRNELVSLPTRAKPNGGSAANG